jgi:hypothetical protein
MEAALKLIDFPRIQASAKQPQAGWRDAGSIRMPVCVIVMALTCAGAPRLMLAMRRALK